MTDIQDYYKNLLIIQYHDLPKATATIGVVVNCATGDEIQQQLYEAFNIDTAVGVQLDMIGDFVGVKRGSLSDEDYRNLILFGIAKNNIKPTMKNIDDIIYQFFGDSVMAENGQNMSITYILSTSYSNIIQEVYNQNLLPAPLGVDVSTILEVPIPDLVFGFERGKITTGAVGFSTKDQTLDGTFLTKNNLVGV